MEKYKKYPHKLILNTTRPRASAQSRSTGWAARHQKALKGKNYWPIGEEIVRHKRNHSRLRLQLLATFMLIRWFAPSSRDCPLLFATMAVGDSDSCFNTLHFVAYFPICKYVYGRAARACTQERLRITNLSLNAYALSNIPSPVWPLGWVVAGAHTFLFCFSSLNQLHKSISRASATAHTQRERAREKEKKRLHRVAYYHLN